MEEVHRHILVTKRQEIIDNIASPLDVADALYASGILTSNHLEDITAEKVRHKQVRVLLDYVKLRGPHAFDLFYDALVKTYNGSAADLLKPGLQRTELPRKWIDYSEVSKPVAVKLCNVNSYLITKYWKSSDVYSMKNRVRGRCVIISNKYFENLHTQGTGRYKDEVKLRQLFEQLHFKVQEYNDLTAKAIHDILSEEAKHTDHKDADCFVLIICSKGSERGILGTDGKIVILDNILTLFNAQNCVDLAFKPKLVFVQANQGNMLDKGVKKSEDFNIETEQCKDADITASTHESKTSSIQNQIGSLQIYDGEGGEIDESVHGAVTGKEDEIKSIPSTADFLIVRATHPGHVSFLNSFGSWFIQAIVWVFQMYAYDREIHQLLLLVNRLVAKGEANAVNKEHNATRQMPRFESSLQKMFFFFPGVFASED